MEVMKKTLITFTLLSLIINFGINGVNSSIPRQPYKVYDTMEPTQKILGSYEKIDSASEGESLEHPGKSWGYVDSPETYGPSDWSKHYPHCGGSSQSPILIKHDRGQETKKWPTNLRVTSPTGRDILQGVLENDGHSFGIKIDSDVTDIKITGGPLQETTYSLKQFHFHFPCTKEISASEHSQKGRKYTAEMHLVFFNDKYPSFESAVNESDGLVVVGFFIKKDREDDSKGITHLKDLTESIIEAHSSVDIGSSMNIYDFVGNDWGRDFEYVYYKGSLTTPPCYESVTWIVVEDDIEARWENIEPWTKLKGDKVPLICNNYRPIQDLNGREIIFVDEKDKSA